MPKSTIADEQLIRCICLGDHGAFADLVRRHTDRYFQFAAKTLQNHADAEDAVQAAFLKLWQKPHLFKPEKGRFLTWFYRLVLNECRDRQQWWGRQVKGVNDFVQENDQALRRSQPAEDDALESRRQVSARQQLIESAIAQLRPKERDLLNLVIGEGLTQVEVAALLGIRLKALESRLARAKHRLQALVHVAEQRVKKNQCDTLTEPIGGPLL